MVVLCWYLLSKQEDHAWARPALRARTLRELELKAGFPSEKGGNQRGKAYDDNLRHVREQERRFTESAEKAHERFVRRRQPKGPGKRRTQKRTDAKTERAS